LARNPAPAALDDPSQGIPGWGPDVAVSETQLVRSPARVTPSRVAAQPVGTETLMGFAGLGPALDREGAEPATDEVANGQTLMGFAAAAANIPDPVPERSAAAGSPGPVAGAAIPAVSPAEAPRALERRQPPGPDTVQMSPFADEPPRENLRRAVAVRAQRREDDTGGLSLTAVMWIVVLIAAAA